MSHMRQNDGADYSLFMAITTGCNKWHRQFTANVFKQVRGICMCSLHASIIYCQHCILSLYMFSYVWFGQRSAKVRNRHNT